MQQSGAGRHESEDATVPDGAFRHRRHDERIHASGAGGCGSVDGQDGGSRVSSKRAGEAEWSERRKGKTEQEDVQSGIIRRSSAHRHNGGGRFFRWWKIARKYGTVEVQIGICMIQTFPERSDEMK